MLDCFAMITSFLTYQYEAKINGHAVYINEHRKTPLLDKKLIIRPVIKVVALSGWLQRKQPHCSNGALYSNTSKNLDNGSIRAYLQQGFGSGSARIRMFLPCPDLDPGKKVRK